MSYEHILVDAEEGVGIVTLNRPDKLNAMNRQLSSELHDAVKRMDADEAIACIVITGAGERAFSAGGDIHEQREDDRRYSQALAAGFYPLARARSRCFSALCGFAYSAACGRTSIRHTRPVCLDRPLAATRAVALPFRRSAADANGVLHQNVTLSPVRLRQSKPELSVCARRNIGGVWASRARGDKNSAGTRSPGRRF